MDEETSIFLDALRILAAFAVVGCHLAEQRIGAGFLWQLLNIGSVAVIVFFVLSGFVVDYATTGREQDAAKYASARAVRIISVVFPAFLLTILLDSAGKMANEVVYRQYPITIYSIFNCVTFLNGSWHHEILGSNEPWWSMGFEVPFYVLYGVALFVRSPLRFPLLIGLGVIFGPRVAMFLPMWLLGVVAYRISKARLISPRIGGTILVISSAILIALFFFTNGTGTLTIGSMDSHSPWTVVDDYLFAVLFAAIIVGFAATSFLFSWIRFFSRPIKWVAGGTFSLYLYHHPILIVVMSLYPGPHTSWSYRGVLLATSIGGSFALAELTERRKNVWRRPVGILLRTKAAAA